MLAHRHNCATKNLPIIHQSDQRLHRDQCLHKVKSNPTTLSSLMGRNQPLTTSIADDLQSKEIEQIMDLCDSNPFYRTKIINALKSGKYSHKAEETLKNREILSSKISTFRCESTSFEPSFTKKVVQLMKQLKLQTQHRA